MVLKFFMLAVAFLLSCTEVERENPYDEESSTFRVPQIVYDEPVSYEGETYETVVIGSQTWIARNLNYNANGSKCYDDNSANCNKYGRLYDWVTAMVLPASCNDDYCDSQISEKHRGICPIGWHIPSDEEWGLLMAFVYNGNGESPYRYSGETVGMYLKAKNGWKNPYEYKGTGNGTDTYGFSALPGGYGDLNAIGRYQFNNVESSGCWWSASKSKTMNPYLASSFAAHSLRDLSVNCSGNDYKTLLQSVRCVKN